MVFGEIVEPSSRAYIDDESIEFPEYELPEYRWTKKLESFSDIESLIFVETKRINELFKKIVLQDSALINNLNNCLHLYKKGNRYIALYEEANIADKLTTGQIVEALELWIKKSKQIYTVTSSSLMFYHKNSNRENLECLVESLSTKNSNNFGFDKLSSPNLITGLGSNVLSYCIFNNLECSSFIFYFNNTPPDSVNSKLFVDLAKNLSLSPNCYNSEMTAPSHNLYM